ncbi:RNA-guided endonuclease InsQ/TnpB family protein [Streptomyces sp. NPDC056517]|uniref:RNA-guided endonuclease InsQ/TnpB family protein n=1 Tax=unclassified Streptomyces TaxID=2593676 RepID=UPI0036772412
MTTEAIAEDAGRARWTFRVRLSSTARRQLEGEWDRCRWIWNESVAQSKIVHSHNGATGEKRTCGPAQLDKMLTEARARTPWLREGSSVPQQQCIRDFGKSRAKAQKDINDRLPMHRRAGMPRWKKKHEARPSLNYTRRGFRLKHGRLHLAGGVVLSVVWSRNLPADPSSVRIYQDLIGHWYASFVVPVAVEPLPKTGRMIGIDWGVRETATTTSDDHDLPQPQHGKAAAHKIARYQRMMARRQLSKGKPGSKGYREAKLKTAKLHKKVARQRRDTARKWAKSVVRDHDIVVIEDFKPKFLANSTMAKKAADAAIGATKTALIEMGRKHGRTVYLVHPAHTTMDCAQCGARAKHALPLSERTYTCSACGAASPRDKNSARVMLVRAGLNPADVEGVGPPGRRPRWQPESEIPTSTLASEESPSVGKGRIQVSVQVALGTSKMVAARTPTSET